MHFTIHKQVTEKTHTCESGAAIQIGSIRSGKNQHALVLIKVVSIHVFILIRKVQTYCPFIVTRVAPLCFVYNQGNINMLRFRPCTRVAYNCFGYALGSIVMLWSNQGSISTLLFQPVQHQCVLVPTRAASVCVGSDRGSINMSWF